MTLKQHSATNFQSIDLKELMAKLHIRDATSLEDLTHHPTMAGFRELNRRYHEMLRGKETYKIQRSFEARDYLAPFYDGLEVEKFSTIYLNRGKTVIAHCMVSEGGFCGTVADPRVILKKALQINAVDIILAHNHPSGNLQPSNADQELTRRIKEAAKFLDIRVIDHIILTGWGDYVSFADDGII